MPGIAHSSPSTENTAEGARVDTDVYNRSDISHFLGTMLAYIVAPVRVGHYLG